MTTLIRKGLGMVEAWPAASSVSWQTLCWSKRSRLVRQLCNLQDACQQCRALLFRTRGFRTWPAQQPLLHPAQRRWRP